MGVGWPMGPCTLVDLVGIDIHIHAAEAMYEATGDERAKPPERLREMAAEGRLGRKTGRGFYDYAKSDSVTRACPYVRAVPVRG